MDGKLTLTCMNQAMAQMMGGEYVCEDEWGEEYPSSLPCDEEACIAACSTCGEQFNCDESHFCDWITCSICYTQYIRGQGHSCTVVGDNNENENGNTGGGSGGSSGTGGGSNTGGNSSNGGESSNTSPPTITGGTTEQRAIIQSVVNELISVYNLNMNGMNIKIMNSSNCTASAKILSGYTGIGICPAFFQFNSYDQAAILWHESYHINYDNRNWEKREEEFKYVVVNPPADIVEDITFIIERDLGFTPNDPGWNSIYESYIRISNCFDPIFNQNEINAYTAEMNNFPNVSEQYAHDRNYELWLYQTRKECFY